MSNKNRHIFKKLQFSVSDCDGRLECFCSTVVCYGNLVLEPKVRQIRNWSFYFSKIDCKYLWQSSPRFLICSILYKSLLVYIFQAAKFHSLYTTNRGARIFNLTVTSIDVIGPQQLHSVEKANKSAHFFVGSHNQKSLGSSKH